MYRVEEEEGDEAIISKPYGNQWRLRILQKMNFLPMRFPHEETMRDLEIYEYVQTLFEGMELHNFMNVVLPAYHDPTLHFLATLKVVWHMVLAKKDIKRYGPGYITFSLAH